MIKPLLSTLLLLSCFFTNNNVSAQDCYPPHMTATVLGKGQVEMKDLQVGDKVLTKSGDYDTLYMMNHMSKTKPTTFVQITTEDNDDGDSLPLELSGMHMVFVHRDEDVPIPASDVQVGDYIQGPNGIDSRRKVTSITSVVRNGLYSPLTTDGTIVINGKYVSSTYCSILGKDYIEFNGYPLISSQYFAHLTTFPLRTFCTRFSQDMCSFQPTNNENKQKQITTPLNKEEVLSIMKQQRLRQQNHVNIKHGEGQNWDDLVIYLSAMGNKLLQAMIVIAFLLFFGSILFVFSPLGCLILFLVARKYYASSDKEKRKDQKYALVKTIDDV